MGTDMDRYRSEAVREAVEAAREAAAQSWRYRESMPLPAPQDGAYQHAPQVVNHYYAAPRRESPATVALRWMMLGVVLTGLLMVLAMFFMAMAVACLTVALTALIVFMLYREIRSRR